MNDIQKYYDNTEAEKPRKNVKYFIEEIKCKPGNSIELGCGAGNDTVYLIKNGWNVLAIDRENISKRIEKRLNNEELKKFRFQQQNFETIQLEESNLLVANYCIPFCNKNNFKKFWQKIIDSIIPNRIFCGKLFGRK